MEKSYQLFSDELKSGDQQILYSTFLFNVQKVFKNMRLYSQTHKLVLAAISDLINNSGKLLEHHQCLVVVKIGKKLITPKVQIDINDSKVADLAKVLEAHHIRKLRFWQGITDEDVIELCKILAMKPLPLLKAGGAKFLLSQAKISKIEIDVASHVEASGEDGTAGLTEFMGHGTGSRKNWLAGLKKAGVDEKSFIDYLLHKSTKHTMMQRELQLAVQVFSDPRAVAELLLFLSTDPDDPNIVSSEVMFNIMQRLENVILMHTSMESNDVIQQLQRSARLLGAELRLQLLRYYCDVTLGKKIISSAKLFSFDLPEYFELILDEYINKGTFIYISCLRLGRERLDELLKYFRHRLENDPDSKITELEDFLDQLSSAARLDVVSSSEVKIVVAQKADTDILDLRIENLQANLELGYLHVLTNFLLCENDEERLLDICVRLAGLLDFYLRKQDYDTLVPIFTKFTKLDGPSIEIFNKVFWKQLRPEQVSAISDFFVSYCKQDQKQSTELLLSLNKYLPKEFIPSFVLKAIRKRSFSSYNFISQLIHTDEAASQLYNELLKSEDIDDKFIAFDFITICHDKEAEHILLSNLKDKTLGTGCRLGIISLLASFAGETSCSQLLRIAGGNIRSGLSAYIYRCAAIEALSIRKEAAAVPVLEKIIAKRNLWRRNRRFALRFGAALALDKINTEESKKALKAHLNKLQRTRFRYVFNKIIEVIIRCARFIKWLVMSVVDPIIYVITTSIELVKLVNRILHFIGRMIKYVWKLLCKIILFIPLIFIKLTKWFLIKTWIVVKNIFILTGSVFLKIPFMQRIFVYELDENQEDRK